MGSTRVSEYRIHIPPKLGARIGQLFSLEGSPRTLDELGALSQDRWLERLGDPQLNDWFREVSSGKEIFGEVTYKTRQRVKLGDGKEVYTACALDAIIEGFFQPVEIESSCYHCNQQILVRMSKGNVSHAEPPTVVVWLGASRGGGCVCETDACPYINFFASKRHIDDWKSKNPNELGMTLTLQQSLNLARKGWWGPFHLALAKAKARPANLSSRPSALSVIQ